MINYEVCGMIGEGSRSENSGNCAYKQHLVQRSEMFLLPVYVIRNEVTPLKTPTTF